MFCPAPVRHSPQAFPLSIECRLSVKANDLLIDEMASDVRKEQNWNHLRKKMILKGMRARVISLFLPWQQSQIISPTNHGLVNPPSSPIIWVNANTSFVSF